MPINATQRAWKVVQKQRIIYKECLYCSSIKRTTDTQPKPAVPPNHSPRLHGKHSRTKTLIQGTHRHLQYAPRRHRPCAALPEASLPAVFASHVLAATFHHSYTTLHPLPSVYLSPPPNPGPGSCKGLTALQHTPRPPLSPTKLLRDPHNPRTAPRSPPPAPRQQN
jgi:hypothetical protein